ncbi:MAG: glucose-6-phosphate isomerase family protein [Methanoregula sp.]
MNKNPLPQKTQSPNQTFSVCWNGPLPEPAVRTAEDLRRVLANPGCSCTGPVYFMYRDVARSSEDRSWLSSQNLRFDITVIPPRDLCGEYNKTKGHYHPTDPSGAGYPEIYEVLAGEAHYLIQNHDCSDVVMIAACAGDVVVVPPGYGHVTINPSHSKILQMANIVSSRFSSNYLGYEAQNGAAFFEWIKEGFVKNPAYRNLGPLRLVKAQRLVDVKDAIPDPLYNLIENHAPVLEFLNRPEKFASLFQGLYP